MTSIIFNLAQPGPFRISPAPLSLYFTVVPNVEAGRLLPGGYTYDIIYTRPPRKDLHYAFCVVAS